MSRLPSPETQLRAARLQIKTLMSQVAATEQERNAYRARATRAEQDASDWKARFDKLLDRTPKEPHEHD